jgi:hypothetical protein
MRLVITFIIFPFFFLMTSGWGGALQYPEYIKLMKENGNYKRFIQAPEEP